jgi:phage protein D
MTEAEAQALGRALFGQRARRFLRVEGTAEGDPAIRVGATVEIAGVNPFFANTYTVTEATHRFDQESGYLTDFLAEGAFLGGPS